MLKVLMLFLKQFVFAMRQLIQTFLNIADENWYSFENRQVLGMGSTEEA